MKKYFIHVNGANAGPYSFEDLRAMRIQKTTPVWYDGLGNWRNAGDVAELRALFASNAATFTAPQNFSNPAARSTYNFNNDNLSGNISGKKPGGNTAVIIVAVVLVAMVGIGSAVYFIQQKKRESMEEVMEQLQSYQDDQYANEEIKQAEVMVDSLNAIMEAPAPEVDYGTSTYSGRFNNYSGGILEVTGSGNQLTVSLKYDDGYGCKVNLSGDATIISDTKIQLRTSSGCKVSIKYSTGFVMIEEMTGCNSEHEAGCTFDGIYSKVR